MNRLALLWLVFAPPLVSACNNGGAFLRLVGPRESEPEPPVDQVDNPSFQEARQGLVAVTVGAKSYFIGGVAKSALSTAVDVYESDERQWKTLRIPTARIGATAMPLGQFGIIAGGFIDDDNQSASQAIDIFHAATNEWSATKMAEIRSDFIALALGEEKLLLAGGFNGADISKTVDVYDKVLDGWTVAELSEGKINFAATTVGSRALFAGGHTNKIGGRSLESRCSDVVDIYDMASNEWSQAKLSAARSDLSAASIGDKAIFAGGLAGDTPSDVIDIYDGATKTWTTARLGEARSHMAAIAVGGKAVFAGGLRFNGEGQAIASTMVDIYDAATEKWSTAKLSLARGGSFALATLGDTVLIADGLPPQAMSAAIDLYNAKTNTWSATAMSVARDEFAVAANGAKAVIFGGITSDLIETKLLEIYDADTGKMSKAN